MKMNVDQMVRRMGGKKYTVTRASGKGDYGDDGKYVAPELLKIEVLGLVQPLTPEELLSIPEGDRTRERFRFYTSTALKQIDAKNGKPADVVDLDGVLYDVDNVTHWANHGKVILVRRNLNDN